MKYRKKPLVIEAFQMTRERRTDNNEWPTWLHLAWNFDRDAMGAVYPTEEGTGEGTISVNTLEGQVVVRWDDWIIKGSKGELYPCKPDIFEMTYDVVIDLTPEHQAHARTLTPKLRPAPEYKPITDGGNVAPPPSATDGRDINPFGYGQDTPIK